jgi:hypothetical protein
MSFTSQKHFNGNAASNNEPSGGKVGIPVLTVCGENKGIMIGIGSNSDSS